MNVSISGTGPELTESELEQFERDHHLEIPGEYRDFLLHYNGGQPDPSEFKLRGGPGRGDQIVAVKRFLGINIAVRTLDLGYTLETFGDRIPSYFFPVARDPGGNLIGIVTDGDALGQMLFWDHELEANEGEAPTDKNLYVIADSFDQFLAKLGTA